MCFACFNFFITFRDHSLTYCHTQNKYSTHKTCIRYPSDYERQRQRDEEDPLVLASCCNEVHFSGFLQEDLRVLGWGRMWGPTWATNQPCISNYHCQISLKEHSLDNQCNHLLVSFLIVSQVWSFGCSLNNKSWFREHQCHNRSHQKHLVMYVKHNLLYRDWRILEG